MAATTRPGRKDDFQRDERRGELHDAIRRLHAIVSAANAITAQAHLSARGVEVARVLLVLAESVASETLGLSRGLQNVSSGEAD